jgi:hypothetical protein
MQMLRNQSYNSSVYTQLRMLTQLSHSSLKANMDIPHEQPKGQRKQANSRMDNASGTDIYANWGQATIE